VIGGARLSRAPFFLKITEKKLVYIKNKCYIRTVNDNEMTPKIKFERANKPDFIEKYKDLIDKVDVTDLLEAIWEFGNERWGSGYNQGYYNPDFD